MSVIEVQSKGVVEDQSEFDGRCSVVIRPAAFPEKGIIWSVNFNKLELVP